MIIIIGAGIAGLTCAKYLQDRGIASLILEASDTIGGRVKTDKQDGFLLDRGFQVLLTAYPEAQKLLNYELLNLQSFKSGALIRDNEQNKLTKMLNPLQEPSALFSTLFSNIGTFADKLRVLRLIIDTQNTQDDIFENKYQSTLKYLQNYGVSDKMILQFFKPFFGGVFLEDELNTSANFFKFIFGKFYEGNAVIPAKGMQEIPLQIASYLPKDAIRFNTKVSKIEGNRVYLENGEKLHGEKIVIATDGFTAEKLLGKPQNLQFNKTTCTYFSANKSPLADNLLVLNPDRKAKIHNLCVPSDIAPNYAPAGKSLISVSTQGNVMEDEKTLTENIKKELVTWFGKEASTWQHLKTYHIPQALPKLNQENEKIDSLQISDILYQCGDYTAYPSLNAAMMTGRKVAEIL
ncbi:NAD(P)/FAD-dependent oxidoreductase [Arcicella rosea]|uniref:Phytoene dehydrogenase-like protein n=1 Tax=Arcicella rosea TaxID=502909 RepID=A0A841EN46_9BACT|nr:NAD(P)/FAD-dependent oxidoreductase [Arcicella rosea]MBB6003634.1 phytoene dehydrogenase-like protein [Arcicella rosea]